MMFGQFLQGGCTGGNGGTLGNGGTGLRYPSTKWVYLNSFSTEAGFETHFSWDPKVLGSDSKHTSRIQMLRHD